MDRLEHVLTRGLTRGAQGTVVRSSLAIPLLLISCSSQVHDPAPQPTGSTAVTGTLTPQATSPTPTAGVATSITQTPDELAKMNAFIADRQANTTVRHSFRNGANDHIDCIDRDTQPALRKNGLTINTNPPPMPPPLPNAILATQDLYDDKPDSEGNDRHCPDGTIPVRRTTIEDLKQFPSMTAYLAKSPFGTDGVPGEKPPSNQGHQYAVSAHIPFPGASHGIESHLNLWQTYVECSDEFTLSQVWVVGQGTQICPVQTAEAGVQVYPDKYGDNQPRFFIYFNPDNYGQGCYTQHSCYNLDCGAFVQTNSNIYIGGNFTNYSSAGGTQYDVRVNVESDGQNWWVGLNGQWAGYWPSSQYWPGDLAFGQAGYVQAGGEMTNSELGGYHSSTSMGSGQFPCENNPYAWFSYGGYPCDYYSDYRQVMYQKRLVQFNDSTQWAYAPTVAGSYQSNPGCYTYAGTEQTGNDGWGNYFFFGGPGYGLACP